MGEIRRLPEGELAIMQIIWDKGGAVSRADIESAMDEKSRLMPSTILTQLSRLTEKGFLNLEKHGRTNLFTPLVTREEYIASQGKSFFRELCSGRVDLFAAALTHSGISKEELSQLRKMLDMDREE